MKKMNAPLPDFSDPPVTEVVLSVQFDTLPGLRTPQVGLLWQEFCDRFPMTEEHPPLDPVIERFGIPPRTKGNVRIDMLRRLPTPRCWFLNKEGTELVQIQQDRFIRNWRKVGDEGTYPRYEKHLRPSFEADLRTFQTHVEREGLGDFRPNQCEVTYVNHIAPEKDRANHGELGKVLTVFQASYSDGFLDMPEDAGLRSRFLMLDEQNNPIGRLHVAFDPGYSSNNNRPIFILTLTARGAPRGEGVDGVLNFLDLGRQWVVRAFASITTPTMHQEWGRKDDT